MGVDISRSKRRVIDAVHPGRLFDTGILRRSRIGRVKLCLKRGRGFAEVMATPENLAPTCCTESGRVAFGNLRYCVRMGIEQFPIDYIPIRETVCIE